MENRFFMFRLYCVDRTYMLHCSYYQRSAEEDDAEQG